MKVGSLFVLAGYGITLSVNYLTGNEDVTLALVRSDFIDNYYREAWTYPKSRLYTAEVKMGFWVFMLLCNLLIPFIMIGFGRYFIKKAGPKEINMAFGYRTSMSMKNRDTWKFAHIYCGKLWRVTGWIMLPLSVAVMLFVIGREIYVVGILGGVICGIQCVFLVVPIVPTEIALRKNFDNNGIRRN